MCKSSDKDLAGKWGDEWQLVDAEAHSDPHSTSPPGRRIAHPECGHPGDAMALFIVLIVGLVVGQTWWDWRETQRESALPQWIGGLALAGMVAAALTGVGSMGSVLYQHALSELQGPSSSAFFWPEAAFLVCGLGVIVVAIRKKSVRTLLFIAGVLAFALWLGMTLYS